MALLKKLVQDKRALTRHKTKVDGFFWLTGEGDNTVLHIVNGSEKENSPDHKRQAIGFNKTSLKQLKKLLNDIDV